LTDEEAKVYDRQIRLWGVEAQQRMRSSKILLMGHIAGTAIEIAKNLVLAGVGAVVLSDNSTVCEDLIGTPSYPRQFGRDH